MPEQQSTQPTALVNNQPGRPRILVIRRDNIGDLVCTLPMITALRRTYPNAHIAALVNSYNRDVLEGHPDLDAVYAYTKAKHRESGETVAAVYWRRLKLMLHLRRQRFDYVILGGAHFLPRALRLARPLGARQIVGFIESGKRGAKAITTPVPYGSGENLHEVEDIFRLLEPFSIAGAPPVARLMPERALTDIVRAGLPEDRHLVIGLHISARKLSNRWPVERFVALARQLHTPYGAHFLLFWSPGAPDDRFHPGDDDKADYLAAELGPDLLTAYRTERLAELIAGLSICDLVICSDGGAMHIAAALGRPIVCLFGGTDPVRWHPWQVPHILLQDDSREVTALSVDDVAQAASKMIKQSV